MDVPSGANFLSAVKTALISHYVVITVFILCARLVVRSIYRFYFHPLSRFPGPKLAAISTLPKGWTEFVGTPHKHAVRLHEKYGEVVRVAPNELYFLHPDAWNDVYGPRQKGYRSHPLAKDTSLYRKSPNGENNILYIPSNEEHTRVRRIFSTAFSDRSLSRQEPLFRRYGDKLVALMHREFNQNPTGEVDMVNMYNFTTFDVMGDFTFGESLHMLDTAEYDPWVSILMPSVKIGTKVDLVKLNFNFVYRVLNFFLGSTMRRLEIEHFQHSVTRVSKRLERGGNDSGTTDLWDLVLNKEPSKSITRGEMDANSFLFMIAGTETTATLLSGLNFFLLRSPEKMEKLVQEVRSAFPSEEAMSMEAFARLPYLNACIKEALRLYPPVAMALPRTTPEDGAEICGYFVPPNMTVGVSHYATYHSAKNFKDPESFIPERWIELDRFPHDNRSSLQPFSIGSRDCIGKNMAYHEMRYVLAKTLYNFDMELSPQAGDWDQQESYILWDKKPLMVRLRPVRV